MNTSLTRFKIEGLHNLRTIDIPIEDNTLVLVGENGTGKSTVVNFIYFLLTSQWSRMTDTLFKSITAEVDGESYTFLRETIQSFAHEDQFLQSNSRFPRSLYDELGIVAETGRNEQRNNLARIAAEYRIPISFLQREFARLRDIPKEDRSKVNALRKATRGSILYLPTYRRIEQDLETVFPDIDIEKFRRTKRRMSDPKSRAGIIELVEFGMEDVEDTLRQRMNEISGKVRQDLSNLTGAYLRDIIRGAYKTVSAEQLAVLKEYTVDDIFRRIPDEVLPAEDKQALRKIVEEITNRDQIDDDNRVVAHFLTKLVEFYEQQQEDERDLRDFVRVCNERYLSGKQFVYDDVAFDVFVEQRSDAEHSSRIPMQALSSGEKQIVSLFSHLYLSAGSDYFVIIDEPELSLSVPWQRNFLPDIRERSRGLVAVTHSPFIYDNDLKPYTHSLEEFSHSFEYDPELDYVVSDDDIPF